MAKFKFVADVVLSLMCTFAGTRQSSQNWVLSGRTDGISQSDLLPKHPNFLSKSLDRKFRSLSLWPERRSNNHFYTRNPHRQLMHHHCLWQLVRHHHHQSPISTHQSLPGEGLFPKNGDYFAVKSPLLSARVSLQYTAPFCIA